MINYLLMSFLMIQILPTFAAESVVVRMDTELTVNGTTSTGTIALNSERSGVSPTTEADPQDVFVPIHNTVSNSSQYYINNVSGTLQVFDKSSPSEVINFPLRVNTQSTARYLYVAARNGGAGAGYKIVKKYSIQTFPTNSTNSDITFPVSPSDICSGRLSGITNCASLNPGSTTETEIDVMLYFFLSSESKNPDEDITITNSPESAGVHYRVYLSNKVYSASTDFVITINNVKPGDGRLVVQYTSTGGVTSNFAKSVKVFKHSTAAPSGNSPIGSGVYSGSVFGDDFTYGQNGEVTLVGLANDTPIEISVLFLDKFLFASTLSESKIGEPLAIEQLLKKNACFLLTAGFGEDHFIIDYFRSFRDNVLSHSFVGRSFISAYYELAPKYALVIYQHEYIRAFIRGAAYILYFIFNYFFLVVTFSAAIGVIFFYKNKDKIKI